MKSFGTSKFWILYRNLPESVRRTARRRYHLWLSDPAHPSLHFKPIGELWSIRITDDYRALALRDEDVLHWFWIGTHAEYDAILNKR